MPGPSVVPGRRRTMRTPWCRAPISSSIPSTIALVRGYANVGAGRIGWAGRGLSRCPHW